MSSSKSMALPVPTQERAGLLGAAAELLPDDGADDDDELPDEAAAESDERKGEAEMIEATADGCGLGVLESIQEVRRRAKGGRGGQLSGGLEEAVAKGRGRERFDHRSRPMKRIMGVRRRASEACMTTRREGGSEERS